jgi:hypothetical protein
MVEAAALSEDNSAGVCGGECQVDTIVSSLSTLPMLSESSSDCCAVLISLSERPSPMARLVGRLWKAARNWAGMAVFSEEN